MGKMAFGSRKDLDDDALLRLYAKGDARASRALVDRHLPKAYGLALRTLRDAAEAEDVAQEAMMRLWKMAPRWNPGQAKLSTWLYRVTANLCIDRLRKKPMAALDQVPEPIDEKPGSAEALEIRERAGALRQALQGLPERQREAVVMRHIDGLSNPEIARILETTVEAVEGLTARGLKGLRKTLLPRRETLGLEE